MLLHRSTMLALFYATAALAAPARRCIDTWGYATFCNDNACSVGCGEAVYMGSGGCLANEHNRNCICIQGACGRFPSLLWSPDSTCNCQSECQMVPDSGVNHCRNLNGNNPANSFRFVTFGNVRRTIAECFQQFGLSITQRGRMYTCRQTNDNPITSCITSCSGYWIRRFN